MDPLVAQSYCMQLGKICQFLCSSLRHIQQAMNRPTVANNKRRQFEYSHKLAELLHIQKKKNFFMEDLVVAVGILDPSCHDNVKSHVDQLNDSFYAYSKTCCFSSVFLLDGKFVYLQILLNFRKTIGDYCMPFFKNVKEMKTNVQRYLIFLQNSYDTIFTNNGLLSEKITPFDRKGIYLDDRLPYSTINIGEGITQKLLMLMIGVSRVLSWSMTIQPLYILRTTLGRRQIIELAFFASLLNTNVRFHHVMMNLIKSGHSFNKHPYYNCIEMARE